jgi:hypothetical protein
MMETPASENQKEEQPKSETEKEKVSHKSWGRPKTGALLASEALSLFKN